MKEAFIYNINQLKLLLEEKYGERINIDSLYILMGSIKGVLDSKSFGITFEKNKYLILSTPSNSKSILDVLIPFLTLIMGNHLPICSYDLLKEVDETKDTFTTIEWDVLSPERRINDIVSGNAFDDNSKILNLKIYHNVDLEMQLKKSSKKV